MKLPPYPKYKASGVQWVRQLPEHWSSLTLRRVATRFSGGTPDRNNDSYWSDGSIPWINSGAVNQGLITEPSTFISEDGFLNSSAKWVPKGALVMALAGQGKTKAMVAQTAIATTCNQSMAAICPDRSTNARYLYWLLVSQYDDIRNMAGGEQRDGLNLDILGSIPILKIPDVEQRAIADFLDRETARLDTLVGKKRELIEKLKEKRTALISRAVTRGLNSNVKLKPSGIEWLGDIPEHWGVKRLSFLCAFQQGKAHEPFIDAEGQFICVNSRFVSTEGETRKFCTENHTPVSKGDILMVMSDLPNGRALAKAYYVRDDAPYAVNQRVCRLSATAADSRYLFYQLNRSPGFLRYDDGSNQTHLSNAAFTKFPTAIPPSSEQRSIADYLDCETAKIDKMIEKVEAAIEKLQEYRTALITAAVTGKIDVRKESHG